MTRHGRACPGHPRLSLLTCRKQGVDARIRGPDGVGGMRVHAKRMHSIQILATAFFPFHHMRLSDCTLAYGRRRARRINQYGPPRTSDFVEYLPWVYSFETNSN
jgi:hypothetical protein